MTNSSDDFFSSVFKMAHRVLGISEYTPDERRRLKRTLPDTSDDPQQSLPQSAPAPTPDHPTRPLAFYEGELLLSTDAAPTPPAYQDRFPYSFGNAEMNREKDAFPYCFIPLQGADVLTCLPAEMPLSNAGEQSLQNALHVLKDLCPDLQLLYDVSFPVRDHTWRFTSAIALLIPRLHLYVAVSVDPAYDLELHTPLHYYCSMDCLRNLYLSDYGWIVLRFSEHQALRCTTGCVRTLAELIGNVTGDASFASLLMLYDPLQEEERSDYPQAVKAAEKGEREAWLTEEEKAREMAFCDRVGDVDESFVPADIHIRSIDQEPLKQRIREVMKAAPSVLLTLPDTVLSIKSSEPQFFATNDWREGFTVTLDPSHEHQFVYLDEVKGIETEKPIADS